MPQININQGPMRDIYVIEPMVYGDKNGYFMETFNAKSLRAHNIMAEFAYDNQSFATKGTLRGLHFQKKYSQSKIVRVIKGEVFYVVVDMRRDSKDYGKWFGITLSADNKQQLYIGEGFAHGFLVTSDDAEICYKCTDVHRADDECGIAWNDPNIGIEWPGVTGTYRRSAFSRGYVLDGNVPLKLSDKDQRWLNMKDLS
ncbi:dTDP-4-dehydrorhamnose 3,5-epimerase [bacterium]|nr:dTDP-4-dehydrorhamnose 3,5-epimerase [bacterium]